MGTSSPVVHLCLVSIVSVLDLVTTEMICVCLLLGRQHNPQVKSYGLKGEGPCFQAWQPVLIPSTHTVGETDY